MENLNNGAVENTETLNVETEVESEGKFYTPEDIALIEQKAGDKRISQYQKTLEKKQRESEKLRNMSESDKRLYDLEQRENAIAEKELLLARAENKSEGLSILADKGLDSRLINFVLDEDAETMYENIKVLDSAFKKSVKMEVERRLASKTPTANLPQDRVYTKADFAKMSIAEMQELANTNPELFRN